MNYINRPKVVINTVAIFDDQRTITPDTTAFELLVDERWKEIDKVVK